ncbi:stalk domain-containing protein [Paenibacillus sp. RC67]|uniref:stalk domain-containing protein n=1 Tax=Paenibacillus sp. RC67 TaxID=3039392 RepID=UPI0024ACF597|nr:stalk domain-containing protein [Paenibacillus sp. RC67]
MQKKQIIVMMMSIIVSLSLTIGVYAVTDIRLFVNNHEVNAPLDIKDGNAYVPLRVVTELLGAKVNWNEDKRTININNSYSKDSISNEGIPTNDGGNCYPVDIHVENGPMMLDISKITLSPAYQYDSKKEAIKALIVSVNLENTSDREVIWNLVRGQIVLNTREYIQTGLPMISDQVDGKFYGKQQKQGDIVFELKGEINNITSLTYIVDSPLGFNIDYLTNIGTEEAVHINLKK